MNAMTIDEAQKYLADMSDAKFLKSGKGLIPQWRKVGAYLKKQSAERLKKQHGPDGQSWDKTWVKPKPKVGDKAPILLDNGRFVTVTLKSAKGKKRANAARKKSKSVADATKPQKALYRSGGKYKTTLIYDFLVRNVLARKKTLEGRSFKGSAFQYNRNDMWYGFNQYNQWIKRLHYGGRYRGGTVPPRPIIGLNKKDIDFITGVIRERWLKYFETGR